MSNKLKINREFYSIEIELACIRLKFEDWRVQINSQFSVVTPSLATATYIDPWTRTGTLETLWSLLNEKCLEIALTAELLTITFSNGALIHVKNTGDFPELAMIWHPSVDALIVTRYPADLEFFPNF